MQPLGQIGRHGQPQRTTCAFRCNEIQSVGSDGFGQILSDCYTVDTDKWERRFHGLTIQRAGVRIHREGGEEEN